MAVHSLQQRGSILATMVNNEQVGCLHTHVQYIYTYGVLDVCSTLADPTVLNYSGLNIAYKLKGGRPWMLKLLVMAVYLIACSHVRISSCSASTPLFSYQRVWECFMGLHRGPAPQRWVRGWSSNRGWSRTIGERTELWERAQETLIHSHTHTNKHTQTLAQNRAHVYTPTNVQAHLDPLTIHTVDHTVHADR